MRVIAAILLAFTWAAAAQSRDVPVVLQAARMLDVSAGLLISPAEVLIQGDHIVAAGQHVGRPAGVRVIDLGDSTLMPGLIDAHVHLFLHPGAEDMQAIRESVAQRVILAALAAKTDLMAGFTAERDMGSEGAGSADGAVRDAIDGGLIPGPRLRVSGNAIDIRGGHEDAIAFNPAAHVPSNADYADGTDELIRVMRQQHKEGSDFAKIYETGPDVLINGSLTTPFQYTEPELRAAVSEAARLSGGSDSVMGVAVHCTGEPAAGFAVNAGVASVDHAYFLSENTMQQMKARHIYAVPTFAIMEYFADHAESSATAARERALQEFHAVQFKRQLAAGVPFAVGSDVGPFPHGTQARELELMVQYGMPTADVLRADLLNGARLLGWAGHIGELKSGYYADVIAVDGNPLENISALEHVRFVMKSGTIYYRP